MFKAAVYFSSLSRFLGLKFFSTFLLFFTDLSLFSASKNSGVLQVNLTKKKVTSSALN
jgi:hypothetical protein